MNYVYIASGHFGVQVLKHLDPKPTLVITGADKPGGRGMKEMIASPVKKLCLELKLPFAEAKSKADLTRLLNSQHVTSDSVILLTDFGMIIPSALLNLNDNGIWNIHPSLLPQYRGTTPIQSAILNGDTETGVTIMQMDAKIDHGPIIAQEKMSVDISDTNITLSGKLAQLGAGLFNEQNVSDRGEEEWQRRRAQWSEQKHSEATYTKKLAKEDGFVPLEQLAPYLEPIFKKYNLSHLLPERPATRDPRPEIALHNKIRALLPWPAVWTKLTDESVLKVTGSTFDSETGTTTITTVERNGKKYLWDRAI